MFEHVLFGYVLMLYHANICAQLHITVQCPVYHVVDMLQSKLRVCIFTFYHTFFHTYRHAYVWPWLIIMSK